MKPAAVRLLGIVLVVAAMGIVWTPMATFFAVDSCLDHGGSYDYAKDICDFDQSHPYEPRPSAGSVAIGLAALLGGTGFFVVALAGWIARRVGMRSNNALEQTREG